MICGSAENTLGTTMATASIPEVAMTPSTVLRTYCVRLRFLDVSSILLMYSHYTYSRSLAIASNWEYIVTRTCCVIHPQHTFQDYLQYKPTVFVDYLFRTILEVGSHGAAGGGDNVGVDG